jgi:hypothetical protein
MLNGTSFEGAGDTPRQQATAGRLQLQEIVGD